MPVYLHLDVDVIDSAELPGLRFPSGPGPAVTQIEECLAAVCATADVRAACIACAWLSVQPGPRRPREPAASRESAASPGRERYHPAGPPESSRISLARCTAEERS